MFRLPHSLPHPLRSELERALCSSDPPAVLSAIVHPFLQCFQAEAIVASVQVNGAPPIPLAVSEGSFDPGALTEAWIKERIHPAIVQELRGKHYPLSYSRFSWPFPHCTAPLLVPTEYTLIIPFSSEHVVRLTTTPLFHGYLALLLPSFPSFQDELVQLIITLPSLLSELFICSISASSIERRSLHHLAYEVRQHSLAALRLTSILDGNREVIASLAQVLNHLELSAEECLLPVALPPPSTTPLSVNQIVLDTVALLKPLFDTAEVPVVCELDTHLPPCLIDPGLFPVVVHRLLDDLLKLCSQGDPLTVRTRYDEPGTVILELFFQTASREEHDLSLVQHLIEAHDGRIFTYQGADTTAAIVVELPQCRESER